MKNTLVIFAAVLLGMGSAAAQQAITDSTGKRPASAADNGSANTNATTGTGTTLEQNSAGSTSTGATTTTDARSSTITGGSSVKARKITRRKAGSRP